MKQTLKKLLCGILCAAAVFTSTSVYAVQTDETGTQTKQTENTESVKTDEKEGEEKTGLRYDPESPFPVYSGYTPDYSGYNSAQYELFMDILKLYTDTHLYEFTEGQAAEAFIMKLLRENPELMNLFLDTLLTTMDPYSGYYEAGTGLASDGSSKGYGIRFASEENGSIKSMGLTAPGLYVIEVVNGSPAQQAGIMVGDRIVSVEGLPLDGLTLDGASYLLKNLPYVADEEFDAEGNSLGIPNEPEFIITNEETGKKEYPIHLDIERNGEIIPVKMLKGRVRYSDVSYERSPDKTYSYIQVTSFSSDSVVKDFASAIEKAKKESNGNLLIDLRDNTGGSVEAAIDMINMLIEEKDRVILYYNSRNHTEPEPIYSEGTGYTFEKITILVNEYSASASELFAMALSYNCGAIIVGTPTFGKGVGQQGYTFANGDMFTITSLEILDPLKRSYHNIGLTPDVEIDVLMTKYDFPENVGELMFIPTGSIPNEDPTAEEGAELPIMEIKVGDESENILALEKRLNILGFLRESFVDGKADENTLAAVKSYEVYIYGEPAGTLDEREVKLINSMSEKYKNHYYYYDSQMEVAKMSFSSRSQAKRKAKELNTEASRVQKEYEAYLQAEKDKIKAEEEAAEKAEEEAEKAEEVTPQQEENAADN